MYCIGGIVDVFAYNIAVSISDGISGSTVSNTGRRTEKRFFKRGSSLAGDAARLSGPPAGMAPV